MKTTICVPANVYQSNGGDELIEDERTLRLLDRKKYEEYNCYDYMDYDLLDVGVIGGVIHFKCVEDAGLWILTEYWSPGPLSADHLDKLVDETLAQMSDGIGENGFEFTVAESNVIVFPVTDRESVYVDQDDDGKPVPPPPRLARCARLGDLEGLLRAIEAGDDVNAPVQGFSPLIWAIRRGSESLIPVLLRHGADPDFLDPMGHVPLHCCALSNDLSDEQSASIARYLLENGADKHIATPNGHTALSYAENRGKVQLMAVLQ